jgi:hypothetical protein
MSSAQVLWYRSDRQYIRRCDISDLQASLGLTNQFTDACLTPKCQRHTASKQDILRMEAAGQQDVCRV